jgi:hypothetical protein
MSLVKNGLWAGRQCGLFASRSLAAHLLRGVIASTCLAWAFGNHDSQPVLALAAAVGAVIAMRGCPMCWTIGLFETIAARLKA